MTKIKNTVLVGAVATTALLSTPVLADSPLAVGGINTLSGRIVTQSAIKSGNVTTSVAHAEVKANIVMTESLRAVIALELASALNNTVDSDDLDRIVEEAYIEMDSKYATIRLGKMSPELNELFANMAIPENDALYSINRKEGVMAIQLEFTDAILDIVGNVVDSLEVTVFENGENDFKVSDNRGVNVRATKQLTEKVKAEVAALWAEHAGGQEKGASISLAYDMNADTDVWVKVQWMDNNPTYAGADYGAVVGMSKEVGPGTLVLQASFVDTFGTEIGTSYHLPVSGAITLSPEVRHNMKTDNTTFGLSMTIEGQKRFKSLSDLAGQ